MGELFLMCCMSSIVSSGAGAGGYFLGYIPGTVKYYERKILELAPKVKSSMLYLINEMGDDEHLNLFDSTILNTLKDLVKNYKELDVILKEIKEKHEIKTDFNKNVNDQLNELEPAHKIYMTYYGENNLVDKVEDFIRVIDEIVPEVKSDQHLINRLKDLGQFSEENQGLEAEFQKLDTIVTIIREHGLVKYKDKLCPFKDILKITLSNNEFMNNKIPEASFISLKDENGQPNKVNTMAFIMVLIIEEKCLPDDQKRSTRLNF